MKISLLKFASIAALVSVLSIPSVLGLTLNSPNVVGVFDGALANANPSTEIVAAQTLLTMLKSTTSGTFNATTNLYPYQTSDTEYYALLTLDNVLQPGNTSIAGYDWGFAKYNGKNAGYVLFYLGGAAASTIVPNHPASLWTTKPDQYALSHLTVFNQTPPTEIEIPRVPDSGATATLLGAALVGLALLRHRRHS